MSTVVRSQSSSAVAGFSEPGMPCAIYHQLPAAYCLAARFRDDFDSAMLHAINGGGQNQAHTILTGALVGAQV